GTGDLHGRAIASPCLADDGDPSALVARPVELIGLMAVVGAAVEMDVGDRRLATNGVRHGSVVILEMAARAALPSIGDERASPAVARPDGATHRGRDVSRVWAVRGSTGRFRVAGSFAAVGGGFASLRNGGGSARLNG